jgi:hypothetical protein
MVHFFFAVPIGITGKSRMISSQKTQARYYFLTEIASRIGRSERVKLLYQKKIGRIKV